MPEGAPLYRIDRRAVYSVEHPMLIKNDVDKALKTFGIGQPFERIFRGEDPEGCVPLYLRPSDPMCAPILSHHTATTDVLLKITVPKRTGRKRKRGSQGPFQGDVDVSTPSDTPLSLVKPTTILRSLRANKGNYKVEAVGEISHTHRFRTLPDFHHSVSNTEFFQRFQPTVLPANASKLREFKLDSSMGWEKNQYHIPPPSLSTYGLPFNWGWHQNADLLAEIDTTGNTTLINKGKMEPIKIKYLVSDAVDVPQYYPGDFPDDPEQIDVVKQLQLAFRERPIWTRRALKNRFSSLSYSHLLRYNIQYVAYTFKGGPWRDALVKFGLDPRTDSKYRFYQTVVFKIYMESATKPARRLRITRDKTVGQTLYHPTSHFFDGESFVLDGKVWQLCDLTDPLLARLVKNSKVREKCDYLHDGWYTNGALAKIKGIMRTKLDAVQLQKVLTEEDFEKTLAIPDHVPEKEASHQLTIPLPLVWSSEEHLRTLKEQGPVAPRAGGIKKYAHYKERTARLGPYLKDAKKRQKTRETLDELPDDEEEEFEEGMEDDMEDDQEGDEEANNPDNDPIAEAIAGAAATSGIRLPTGQYLAIDPALQTILPNEETMDRRPLIPNFGGAVELGDDDEGDLDEEYDDFEEEEDDDDGEGEIREDIILADEDEVIKYPTFDR
ncbi:hypothetical protein HYALB_00005059 [Hymenoscyphus albidus]|uniref:Uncharacterized protein n=1 Tax=Hymenoscyphus albidus TaxID=595503 RepID=A0A9N9LNM0_9HELO|nr:hypothetical protein HYALB_00005059 [Hymenoscyphus albidus]